jgi:hypothetical protein
MKIVFDTNVILSAFLTEGITHRVFNDCIINDCSVASRHYNKKNLLLLFTVTPAKIFIGFFCFFNFFERR